MSVALNTKHLSSFISEEEYAAIYPQVEAAHKQLEAKNGPGSDFLGWMTLPRDYDKEEFARIKAAAAKIREDSDVLVVAGIGGSYLGARAVVEAVKGYVPQRAGGRPEDLLLRQQHQPHLPEQYHQPVQGQALLHQRHLQVRHHHRDLSGFPRAARAAGKGDGRGRSQQAHLRHHRPCQGHSEAAGRRTGLAYLCGSR